MLSRERVASCKISPATSSLPQSSLTENFSTCPHSLRGNHRAAESLTDAQSAAERGGSILYAILTLVDVRAMQTPTSTDEVSNGLPSCVSLTNIPTLSGAL
eukprot:PhM_4_TR1754/c0_g1_i1/m.98447